MQDDATRKRVLATIIERFNRAWPKAEFSKDEIREWHNHLEHLDLPTAEEVVKLCISTHKWKPTISEFLEASRQVRRHAEATVADGRPLPEHLKKLQKQGLGVQRALLQRRASRSGDVSRGHDHREGWESCVVCSGAEEELASDSCMTCEELVELGMTAHHCN